MKMEREAKEDKRRKVFITDSHNSHEEEEQQTGNYVEASLLPELPS